MASVATDKDVMTAAEAMKQWAFSGRRPGGGVPWCNYSSKMGVATILMNGSIASM